MNVIDYITITCNLKKWLITSDYMKKCNRLQLITITNYDYPMSDLAVPAIVLLEIFWESSTLLIECLWVSSLLVCQSTLCLQLTCYCLIILCYAKLFIKKESSP